MDAISTTDLCKILGFTLKADFIKNLGVEPVFVTKTATLWNPDDVDKVRANLIVKLRNDMGDAAGIVGKSEYQDSVIAFLSDKTKTHTIRAFQQAKIKTKPWSKLPKGEAGKAIRDTFCDLEAKGICKKNPDTGVYQLIYES